MDNRAADWRLSRRGEHEHDMVIPRKPGAYPASIDLTAGLDIEVPNQGAHNNSQAYAIAHAMETMASRDLRAQFEAQASDPSHKLRRSRKGTYVNPALARDWKWFQAGHAITQVQTSATGGAWEQPTTVAQRLGDAMQLLCGGMRPPEAMVAGWLDHSSEELQSFAADHGPAWAQGIGLIDAAMVMVDQPTEIITPDSDEDHEHRDIRPATPAAGGSSVEDDMLAAVQMMEDGEWAEHFAKTPIGKRLEAAITALHSDLNEATTTAGGAPSWAALTPAVVAGLEANKSYWIAGPGMDAPIAAEWTCGEFSRDGCWLKASDVSHIMDFQVPQMPSKEAP